MRMFILVLLLWVTTCGSAGAQVLISLLLGDKLNDGNVEFGLDGGLAVSGLSGIDPSASRSSLHLGFYFDIKLKDPAWMVHTGVIVKSTMGAKNIPAYSLNDPDLDNVFREGTVTRKLGYFNVPMMIKHQWENNFFAEAGAMVGLMGKATDEFLATIASKDDLTYRLKIRDQYHPLDAGLMAGIGYRLMGGNGMNLSVRYYYGLIDVTIDDSAPDQYNRVGYVALGIPVGVGKKEAE